MYEFWQSSSKLLKIIILFIKQIFNAIYHVPDTILDAFDRTVNETDKNSHSRGLSSSEEKMTVYINLQIHIYTCMHAWSVTQLCLTLCDTLDCRLSRYPVHGIFQTIILEWVAISSSRGPSWPREWTHFSCVSWISRWVLYLSATPIYIYIYIFSYNYI